MKKSLNIGVCLREGDLKTQREYVIFLYREMVFPIIIYLQNELTELCVLLINLYNSWKFNKILHKIPI